MSRFKAHVIVTPEPTTHIEANQTESVTVDSDREHIYAYQSGDSQALAFVLKKYSGSLWRYFKRQGASSEDAQDLTQHVCCKIMTAASTWKPQALVRTWIFHIARNVWIDHQRKAKHRKTFSLDSPLNNDAMTTHLDALVSSHVKADHIIQTQQLRRVIQKALDSMPSEQKDVFILRQEAELSFEDIANMMGENINTIKSRMRYAIQNIKKHLETEGLWP